MNLTQTQKALLITSIAGYSLIRGDISDVMAFMPDDVDFVLVYSTPNSTSRHDVTGLIYASLDATGGIQWMLDAFIELDGGSGELNELLGVIDTILKNPHHGDAEIREIEQVTVQRTQASIHQPRPKINNTVPIYELVMKDVKERAEAGKERYGTYLQADNGRDALWDAYQEALDLTMYLRQLLKEKEGR